MLTGATYAGGMFPLILLALPIAMPLAGALARRKGHSFWLFFALAALGVWPAFVVISFLKYQCPRCQRPLRRSGNGRLRCDQCGLETIRGIAGETVIGSTARNVIRSASGETVALEDPDVVWKCPKCAGTNPNTTFRCRQCEYKIL